MVSEFNPAGEWVGWITSTPTAPLVEPAGLALTSAGNVYVGDPALARVDVFGPGVALPDVSTGKATKLARTTAALAGTVNGDGKPGHYLFEYGTTKALGSSTAPAAFGPGEEKVAASASELHAGTTYYYRLAAENVNGTNYGTTRELQTPTAVEGLATGSVSALQPDGATLNGTLSPNGVDAHYYFQWGKTTSYGNETPVPPGEDAGSGSTPVPARAELAELTANTIYHYRLVASNSFGTTNGADQEFQTSGPPRITSKPATGIGHETATLNAEVNADELTTTYHFEYGETASYGTETPAGGASLGAGGKPVPVTAALTGLKLGVTYHYRLTATNSAGTTVGPDQTLSTIPPALITVYATEVTPTTATLGATINPLGHDTTYYFQYGATPCAPHPEACTSTPTPPGKDIGAGEEPVGANLAPAGLTPDTTYYYRVIATNSLGDATSSEHTLTTPRPVQPTTLPDNRAWEMVTPPDKGGAPVEALTREGGIIRTSEDGNKLTYVVDGALGENVQGNRTPEWQQVLAARGPASWTSQDIATPSTRAKGVTVGSAPEYQYFTPDLTTALVEPAELGPGAEPPLAPGVSQGTPYLRDNTNGSYLPLVTEKNTAAETMFGGQVHFLSATPSLSAIVMSSSVPLGGPGTASGLYEWKAGTLSLVSILPAGTPATGAELGLQSRILTHAISDNGDRVVWTRKEDLGTRGGHLYMRDTATGETLQLDAAKGVTEPSKGSALFQAATSDGSRVLFIDRQRLTPDSTAEPGQGAGRPDLYECEIVETAGKLTCELRDLTVARNEGEHASVQGLMFGTSDDGATVYLVAQGVIADNQNAAGEAAVADQNNLYQLHFDGSQWHAAFIATLSSEDSPEWEGDRLANPAFLTARVSPSGRYLAFMSAASLTGYDNVDASPEAKGARDEEVYLYDDATASLQMCIVQSDRCPALWGARPCRIGGRPRATRRQA